MNLPQWLAYIERQHPKAIDMGLERVRDVADRLGLDRPAERVITVGGTNGKGSTVAFIAAIARAAGWRVGAYTSPHLLAYNERVRIDGEDAGDAALVAAFEAVEAACDGTTLTYFEYGTLAALWLFQRAELDLAVLEVGLGGRLDATNIVDADVAVITTVDLDHQDWLGDDREAIGFEKAGIARPGKPLILGEDDPPASVLRHAYALGAPAIRAGCDFFFEPGAAGRWHWREVGCRFELPMPRLDGPFQLRNAATAIAALCALDSPGAVPAPGRDAIAQGVVAAHAAGRLQRFVRAGTEIVVDVAHNPQAARHLAAWVAQHPVDGRNHAVLAVLADKDVQGIAAPLAPHVDAWHVAGLEAGGRGQPAEVLAQRLHDAIACTATRHVDVGDALAAARQSAVAGDRILVLGSFLTAAAALQALAGD